MTLWNQCMSSINSLVKEGYSKEIYIAGYFGNKNGNDLDSFIVFKKQDLHVIKQFLQDIRENIILPYRDSDKKILPFRYATSKPYLPYLCDELECHNVEIEYLPLHLLMFPDVRALLEWEDHEIIRQILSDICFDDNLWVGGSDEINFILSHLKERDYGKRKLKYEELLFGAFQDATLNALKGAVERSVEQSAYAVRYLALDDATKKYDKVVNNKPSIATYMKSSNLPGADWVLNEYSPQEKVQDEIIKMFDFWRPSITIGSPNKIERLDIIKGFCDELKTPILVFDEQKIIKNMREVLNAFNCLKKPVEVCYAIKANQIVPILQLIADIGMGGLCATSYSDVASLRRVKVTSRLVNVHLSYPDDDFLLEVLNSKYRIILTEEVTPKRIIDLYNEGSIELKDLEIYIRIKPEVANRQGYHRFGISYNYITDLIELFKYYGVDIQGFAIHANAASTDPKLWAESTQPLKYVIETYWEEYFNKPPTIILGGGIASSETLSKNGVNIRSFADEVAKVFQGVSLRSIIVETGRYIVGDAGYVYAKINGIKAPKLPGSISTLIIDAGSNFLIPLDSADFSFHDIDSKLQNNVGESFYIADAWSSFGIFGRATKLSSGKKAGDHILIGNAGAYTYSMASNSGDGIPPYRILKENQENYELLNSYHFVQDAKYLNAKMELDKPLLKSILSRIKDLLSNKKEIAICDVGCGTGAYLRHIIDSGYLSKFQKITYLGIDISQSLVQEAKKYWKSWKNVQSKSNISINFQLGSVYSLQEIVKLKKFDLVVGLSLLEYTELDPAIQQLGHICKKGGLLHLPINYDAETQFEPTNDRLLEEQIIKLFNDQVIPNPYCGRELYTKIDSAGFDILDFSLDDWLIRPSKFSPIGEKYTDHELLFLNRVIDAIDSTRSENIITDQAKRGWIHVRKSQIKRGELIFICRQCSLLAQK